MKEKCTFFKSLFLILVVTLIIGVVPVKAEADLPEVLIKPFPILTWVAPSINKEQIDLYKGANFTVMSILPDETKYEKFKSLWDGNYIVIREWSSYTYDDMLKFHPEDENKIGYLIGDEPTIPKIDEYVPIYNNFRQSDPSRLCLVNLFPSGVSESRLGGSFLEYMDEYFDKLSPRYCSLDNYPCFWFDQESGSYYHDLELTRHYSKKNGTKQIGFVQVYSSALHRDVSESDVLWQVNSLLAYGCKALWYFNFRHPGPAKAYWPDQTPIAAVPEPLADGVFDTRQGKWARSEYYKPAYTFGHAVLDFHDKPAAAYPYVKKANAQAIAWGSLLLDFEHVAVRHVLGFKEAQPPVGTDDFANEAYIKSVAAVAVHKSEGFIVSWFRDKQQNPYVMIVNKKHGEYMTCEGGKTKTVITFDDNVSGVSEVSKTDGKIIVTEFANKKLTIDLDAGGAILLRLAVDSTEL